MQKKIIMVSEKLLNEALENAINKVLGEKLDAEEIFGFNKIPEEEVDEQNIDLLIPLVCCGYGGRFMIGEGDNLHYEEVQATLSPDETKEQLMSRLGFKEWQIKVHSEANDIQIMTLFPLSY